jgi:hypothetical protein
MMEYIVMIQYNSNPKKHSPKAKLVVSKQVNKTRNIEGYLICEDCKHNTITFEPSKDGACFCGCH